SKRDWSSDVCSSDLTSYRSLVLRLLLESTGDGQLVFEELAHHYIELLMIDVGGVRIVEAEHIEITAPGQPQKVQFGIVSSDVHIGIANAAGNSTSNGVCVEVVERGRDRQVVWMSERRPCHSRELVGVLCLHLRKHRAQLRMRSVLELVRHCSVELVLQER